MEHERIGHTLHSLNNMIRRYHEFSSHKEEVERVTGNNAWIINYLADNPQQEIYQKDIEERFNITRSTASRVLGLMEQKGFILREAVTQDARLKKITLTEKAWMIRKLMLGDFMELENTLTRGFEEGELDLLRSYLSRMIENIAEAQERKKVCTHD